MYFVYFLSSRKVKFFYVGSTNDLVRRCKEHNTGKVRSTKSKVPLDLVYFEAYTNEKLARARELEIKRNRSKKEAIISRLK